MTEMQTQPCTGNNEGDAEWKQENPESLPLKGKPSVQQSPVRPKPSNKHALRQVLDLQERIHESGQLIAQDLSEESDKKIRASLATALAKLGSSWTVLQDSKRELRGKPRLKAADAKTPKPKSIAFDVGETNLQQTG